MPNIGIIIMKKYVCKSLNFLLTMSFLLNSFSALCMQIGSRNPDEACELVDIGDKRKQYGDFELVPDDAIKEVFLFVDMKTIKNICLINKTFNALFEDSLKKKISFDELRDDLISRSNLLELPKDSQLKELIRRLSDTIKDFGSIHARSGKSIVQLDRYNFKYYLYKSLKKNLERYDGGCKAYDEDCEKKISSQAKREPCLIHIFYSVVIGFIVYFCIFIPSSVLSVRSFAANVLNKMCWHGDYLDSDMGIDWVEIPCPWDTGWIVILSILIISGVATASLGVGVAAGLGVFGSSLCEGFCEGESFGTRAVACCVGRFYLELSGPRAAERAKEKVHQVSGTCCTPMPGFRVRKWISRKIYELFIGKTFKNILKDQKKSKEDRKKAGKIRKNLVKLIFGIEPTEKIKDILKEIEDFEKEIVPEHKASVACVTQELHNFKNFSSGVRTEVTQGFDNLSKDLRAFKGQETEDLIDKACVAFSDATAEDKQKEDEFFKDRNSFVNKAREIEKNCIRGVKYELLKKLQKEIELQKKIEGQKEIERQKAIENEKEGELLPEIVIE